MCYRLVKMIDLKLIAPEKEGKVAQTIGGRSAQNLLPVGSSKTLFSVGSGNPLTIKDFALVNRGVQKELLLTV